MANHRIGTISLDFTIDQKDRAWAMQKQFEQLIDHQLLPKLEKGFDQIDKNGVLIFIDKLDIHLGALPTGTYQEEFVEQVITQILGELRKAPPTRKQRSRLQLSRTEAIAQAFVYSLQAGALPEVFQEWFSQAAESEILNALKNSPLIQEELRQIFQNQLVCRQRLQLQFSLEFIDHLDLLLKTDSADDGIAKATSPPYSPQLDEKISGQTIQQEFDKIQSPTEPEEQLKPFIRKPAERNIHPKINKENQYITNAGLVLVHPYISGDNEHGFTLFEELGLTENHQFKDEAAQERALHILQYLVWGKERQPEFVMVLDKILCGVPEEQPVQRFVSLTDMEKKACARIAKLISADWQGISEMSLEALQETFFQRTGKLSPHSMGHQLRVERKTQDIILSRLPHSLSVIKFLWMKKFLWIEW